MEATRPETESLKVSKHKLDRFRLYSKQYGVSIQWATDKALGEYLEREIEPKLATVDDYQFEKNGRLKIPPKKKSPRVRKIA